MCGVVKVLAKSPNAKFQDHLVECPVSWNVIDLKKHLSELLNAELSHESKLIYSGKLLSDDVVIGTAFDKNSADKENIVYFIMSQPMSSQDEMWSEGQDSVRRRHVAASVPGEVNNLQPQLAYLPMVLNPQDLNSRQRFEQHSSDFSSFWLNNAMSHVIWSQQVYAEYMNQYMNYLEHLGQQNNAVPHEQVGNVAQHDVQQQIPAINVQGGAILMEEDEDDRNRDWLDWAYVVMRFVMLMCILYFYSTPVRFITFVIVSIVFLVYQAGWLNVSFNELFLRQNDGAADDENNGNRMIPQFVSTFWSIVVCFFVSLAPQAPPPINAN